LDFFLFFKKKDLFIKSIDQLVYQGNLTGSFTSRITLPDYKITCGFHQPSPSFHRLHSTLPCRRSLHSSNRAAKLAVLKTRAAALFSAEAGGVFSALVPRFSTRFSESFVVTDCLAKGTEAERSAPDVPWPRSLPR
jgi:hypothetical protein